MKKSKISDTSSLRQKAEELLKSKKSRSVIKSLETDTLKLIHELEVHQIELEIQNEEFLSAISNSEEANEKYLKLYDSAPSGYFTLSKEGTIRQ